MVKTSNTKPLNLALDTDLERLYVSTREGMVLIFNVKTPKSIVMIHSMRLCRPSQNINQSDYIKNMDLDTDRNILLCRAKSGIVSVI